MEKMTQKRQQEIQEILCKVDSETEESQMNNQPHHDTITEKKEAYQELMTLRKVFTLTGVDVSDAVRDEALLAKCGQII